MVLKKCSIEDTDTIISIGKETYFDTFHEMNTKETMSLYLSEAFNEIKIKKEIEDTNSRFYIAFQDNKLSAYLKINFAPSQSDINDPDSVEIERIYVRKIFKGQGIGKELINQSIKIGIEKKCSYAWLGVWEKNTAAIGFYKKMGFKVFAKHKFRMGEELQSDLVLKKMI